MVMSIVSMDTKDLPATIGADICILCISSTIESNLCPFSIMASNPLISLAKSGVTKGSMLMAFAAKSSSYAVSNLPCLHKSINRSAICCVVIMVYYLL